ncbi:50S ribosomal protein L11 methyltransferase [Roseinatronobacter bogoriensis]|uniref:Ribosomal protein L11 methyltransferase n=1 Tax=Roseinatronobacter bogoriensis subsp. barguzinensis TaxID=441209 RepID=A0A2K8KJ29_9RHOB|nr:MULTISPECIES: 50S ribosomal protein L11 methyltransferase [Rhodobaca]ATX66838.1 50S ribosomal protein L11 methyltransferase [Rhodobaca barguzinensis]MBB4206307.1 ribosomal protein L11 methyltransferase [Rhodobaca bogoriensis DSM 18756]TDW41052.1 [LSU ribosomal protein L11P]-lysine N-methyltransferase [Rhodobaca barguzinensis]TDY74770.1 [LSU ribosomal protein L11P]-lysine N-methyltransferase [Rhodobaca bogoriensis DSM 18756]
MPTFTAITKLTSSEAAYSLSEAMENMTPEPTGVGVFEMEDGSGLWEVGGYFTECPDDIELTLLAQAFGATPFLVSELPEIDWVAKVRRDLSPVEAGRFFVYGSHDADKLPEGRVGLLIEASMAFGTGHHGTTLGCLRALDRLDMAGFQGRNVVDIGCGTAVLAMAAAKIWPEPVLASDIDAIAVEVAQVNMAANGLSDRVRSLEATGFDHPELQAAAPFDLVFANILMGPLIELAPEMGRVTAPGGYAILSGLLVEQAEKVLEAYVAAGFGLHHREDIGEWTTLTLKR